jgi:Ca2+-binding RTX toxin-like protein
MRATLCFSAAIALVLAAVPTGASAALACRPWTEASSVLPQGGLLEGVDSLSRQDAWAVGHVGESTLTMHWDGTSWESVASGFDGALRGVEMVSATDVWAVGSKPSQVGEADLAPLTLHWDGSSWAEVSSPDPTFPPGEEEAGASLSAISALSSSDIWAVGGRFHSHSGAAIAMHWDGIEWSLDSSLQLRTATSVEMISTDDVWIGGGDDNTIDARPWMVHWDGMGFDSFKLPIRGVEGPGPVTGVSAVATDDVYAVGARVWHWNGLDWSRAAKISGADVDAASASRVWVASNPVAYWTGHRWKSDPIPVSPREIDGGWIISADALFERGAPANVVGTEGDDVLAGSPGDDVVCAFGGSDIVGGSAGDDLIYAGEDVDKISYASAPSSVTVDLNQGVATGWGADTLFDVENADGSAFDDVLLGDSGTNILTGRPGNDTIASKDGGDTLYGWAGEDQLDPGFGNDVVDGGGDQDTVTYPGWFGVDVNLLSGEGPGNQVLLAVENVIGSPFGDQIRGSLLPNVLTGSGGPDSIFGFDGNDELYGQGGNDALDGGAGLDLCKQGQGTGPRTSCEL